MLRFQELLAPYFKDLEAYLLPKNAFLTHF